MTFKDVAQAHKTKQKYISPKLLERKPKTNY